MADAPTLTTLQAGPAISSALLAAIIPASTHTSTNIEVTGWVSEPPTRGTWSLLYSCFFTIGLCIWTAIHTDIPTIQHSRLRVFLYKLAWVGIAFVSPELVFVVASSQLCRAWILQKKLHSIAQRHVAKRSVKNKTQPGIASLKDQDKSRACTVELALEPRSDIASERPLGWVRLAQQDESAANVARKSAATGHAAEPTLEAEKGLPISKKKLKHTSRQNNEIGVDETRSDRGDIEEEIKVSVRPFTAYSTFQRIRRP